MSIGNIGGSLAAYQYANKTQKNSAAEKTGFANTVKNFAETATQKAAEADAAGNSAEKYPAVLDYIGKNAPEKVKEAFTEAEKETGGFINSAGMWTSADGKHCQMTKMFVDQFVRWLHGETNESDMLGSTVQSAIDAVNRWMYDLDHPLIGATPTRPEDRWLVDKERQFYESFLDKLLALSKPQRY